MGWTYYSDTVCFPPITSCDAYLEECEICKSLKVATCSLLQVKGTFQRESQHKTSSDSLYIQQCICRFGSDNSRFRNIFPIKKVEANRRLMHALKVPYFYLIIAVRIRQCSISSRNIFLTRVTSAPALRKVSCRLKCSDTFDNKLSVHPPNHLNTWHQLSIFLSFGLSTIYFL